MTPFSTGVPAIPAETFLTPALGAGMTLHSAPVSVQQLGERDYRDMLGNDGILSQQLADVNTP